MVPAGGTFALVSDADFERLNQWKWFSWKPRATSTTHYVCAFDSVRGRLYLHREVLGMQTGDPTQVDHHNGDGLNNQRENLRLATNLQNQFNKKVRADSGSKLKGVRWHRQNEVWQPRIKINGKEKSLGSYLNKYAAAYAYNVAAKLLQGEFARLNEIPENELISIRTEQIDRLVRRKVQPLMAIA